MDMPKVWTYTAPLETNELLILDLYPMKPCLVKREILNYKVIFSIYPVSEPRIKDRTSYQLKESLPKYLVSKQ